MRSQGGSGPEKRYALSSEREKMRGENLSYPYLIYNILDLGPIKDTQRRPANESSHCEPMLEVQAQVVQKVKCLVAR